MDGPFRRVVANLRSQNIEDLQVGDYVLAKDPRTGELARKRVVHRFERVSDHLRILVLRSSSGAEQRLETTDEHPFFLASGREIAAGDLRLGDRVQDPHGGHAQIIRSDYEPHPDGITVYNVEVEDFHTYFVAAHGSAAPPVWVHNAKKYNGPPSRKYDRPHIETKAPKPIKDTEVVDDWDDFLGPDQTDIDPRDGLPDPDRIWSADGQRSIRYGGHELGSKPNLHHYHRETWFHDRIENVLQRIQATVTKKKP